MDQNEQPNWTWKEISCDNVRRFALDDEPELFYVIKNGFTEPKKYLIVFEDAYELELGKTILVEEDELKKFMLRRNIIWEGKK